MKPSSRRHLGRVRCHVEVGWVVEAFLFGSVLRGEEGPESDIDVFVRFGHDHSLVEQLDLMVKLSRLTGREVDLLTDIHPVFEPYIRPTLVPIPL